MKKDKEYLLPKISFKEEITDSIKGFKELVLPLLVIAIVIAIASYLSHNGAELWDMISVKGLLVVITIGVFGLMLKK